MKGVTVLVTEEMGKCMSWTSNIRSGIQRQAEEGNIPTSIDSGSDSIPPKARIQRLDATQDANREQAQHQEAYKQHLHEMYMEIIHKGFPY